MVREIREVDLSALATRNDIGLLKRDIERLKHDLECLKRDLTIRLGGMLVVAVGAVATLLQPRSPLAISRRGRRCIGQ